MVFDRRFCIAPMMDLTDRHFRYLFRLISPRSLLYTEMLVSAAIVHGDHRGLLAFNTAEHPLALQLGGSDPKQLALASRIGEDAGYDEINLNCGCPSDRVQAGKIGACLMAEPELVADCIQTMQDSVKVPVTVKCRIGIDEQDSDEQLHRFVQVIYDVGCRVFIVHARKAWLQGLSPRQNREIPPLDYDCVYRLKKQFSDCEIIINGGIKNTIDILLHLEKLDGVMLGREAYYNPFAMVPIVKAIYTEDQGINTREKLVEVYSDYIKKQYKLGIPLSRMTRHLIALYQAVPGARAWRRHLSEDANKASSVEDFINAAMAYVTIASK